MKSLLNFAGWLLLLVVLGFGLVLYNAVHMPALRRLARQSDEIGMWTSEIELLRDSLDRATLLPETTFTAVFSFDELFGGAEGFAISKDGESSLRDIVTMLQQSSGAIAVTGHSDSGEIPPPVRGLYPSAWHYAAAAAASVARGLESWGIAAGRLRVCSAGATKPRDSNSSPAGRMRNRRIEILVLKGQ